MRPIDANPTDAFHDFELEKGEWLESLDSVFARHGREGVSEILSALRNHVIGRNQASWDATLNTPYRNTIVPDDEPRYPGNIDLETRIENIHRWNAMAMVVRAADSGSGVGGHIATYASCATMLEVGFQHFFRARTDSYGGDLVVVQPHACPGVYARAFLEGRLTESQLIHFRRELAPGGGLPSYPHPRALPGFWQMPCASMGLSTPMAIAQARFAKYLERRGLKPANGGRVWCYVGDGEADEPEVLGTINIASREALDNLVLVVNCNLQRLDGPVRGNGKIIQELERSFRGADWNVIKVIWGGGWDALFARDTAGVLLRRMEEAVDGDYQQLSILTGDAQRELWVGRDEKLARLMDSLTDEEVRTIKRGGQDHKKIYAAYHRAVHSANGRPTVIIVKSVKGDGMGKAGQGRNTAHQKKQLSVDERRAFAEHHHIPLDAEAVARCDFYRPPEGSAELQYLHDQRRGLGGYLPERIINCPQLPSPLDLQLFDEALKGSGERQASTTMVVVRILARLMKDSQVGRYVVPIVPDEARTFGMEGLFKEFGIYSPSGQQYTPVDSNTLQPYREAENGQLLQEGICEAGAISSFIAAGTAYAQHGVPTIPFYIFYSMFGFQRVGDFIWAAADMMCRGFLLGGTAGRTTLNGEGLQHQDGHSHLIAATVPSIRAYDPAFGYEVALIIRDGIKRMYGDGETTLYYLTVYNESVSQPPAGDVAALAEGVCKGLYRYRRTQVRGASPARHLHLMGSGAIMTEVIGAADWLEANGVATDIWSVTSYTELARDALACAGRRREAKGPIAASHLENCLAETRGSYVAASDYMKALPLMIAPWVPGELEVLGTDGFGVSEARPDLRAHFEVDANSIIRAGLHRLLQDGGITPAEHESLALCLQRLGAPAS
jgi:pyruvate dehydrogenase E1 component